MTYRCFFISHLFTAFNLNLQGISTDVSFSLFAQTATLIYFRPVDGVEANLCLAFGC